MICRRATYFTDLETLPKKRVAEIGSLQKLKAT